VAIVELPLGGRGVARKSAACDPCGRRGRGVSRQGGGPRASLQPTDVRRGRDAARRCCEEPDERLVELCRAGRDDAFDAIVERYRPLLLRHCARIVGQAAAQDAVQDALLSAWSAIRAGAEIRALRAWLFTIAHRKALATLRDPQRASLELPESLTAGRSTADEASQTARVHETLAALAALPEAQRDALVGSALSGRSGRQIARDLGISECTVRQLVFKARATLRAVAAACGLPMTLVTRLVRRVADPQDRLAVLARAACRSGQADTAARLLKVAVMAIAGATLVSSGALHLIDSQRRASSTQPSGGRVDPTRRPGALVLGPRSPWPAARMIAPVRPRGSGRFGSLDSQRGSRPLSSAVGAIAPAAPSGSSQRLSLATTPTLTINLDRAQPAADGLAQAFTQPALTTARQNVQTATRPTLTTTTRKVQTVKRVTQTAAATATQTLQGVAATTGPAATQTTQGAAQTAAPAVTQTTQGVAQTPAVSQPVHPISQAVAGVG
jgi:RNA polymerase sigma factor (sigma-70 family)